jgi:hypothetical protein
MKGLYLGMSRTELLKVVAKTFPEDQKDFEFNDAVMSVGGKVDFNSIYTLYQLAGTTTYFLIDKNDNVIEYCLNREVIAHLFNTGTMNLPTFVRRIQELFNIGEFEIFSDETSINTGSLTYDFYQTGYIHKNISGWELRIQGSASLMIGTFEKNKYNDIPSSIVLTQTIFD